MALLFIDGFDNNATPYDKWDGGIYNFLVTGRYGGLALSSNRGDAYILKNFSSTQTVIVGMAFKYDGTALSFCRLADSGTVQCSLGIKSQKLVVNNGISTLLGTGNLTLQAGVWYYIEVKFYIDNTSGTAEVRVNGAIDINLTSVDTQTTANAYTNQIHLYTGLNDIDDLYIVSGSGGQRTNFLGDCRVTFVTIDPTDGGRSYNGWTPNTGTDPQAVDDLDPNDDTDYIYASGISAATESLFVNSTISGLQPTSNIFGVQISTYGRKASAGTPDYLQNIVVNNSDAVLSGGSPHYFADNYTYYTDVFEQIPTSGSPRDFTASDFTGNVIEVGVYKDGT